MSADTGHESRSRLTVTTLGAAKIACQRPDGSTSVLGPGKPLALVVYLSILPGREASREHLADLLWADVDVEPGRHALRQTVWYLRRRLFDDVISATRDRVSLNPAIRTDRDEFLAAAEQGDFDSATELYQGDFLPSLALPGGLEFEHWADVERRRLRHTFLLATEMTVRRRLELGRYRPAVALARRARDADPESEAAWRLLLEALVSADDRLGASAEADALRRRLAVEGWEPEPATSAALAAVMAEAEPQTGDAGRRALSTELIGRAAEFSALVAAWDRVRHGACEHIHVVAPAGVGKSRLLTDFVARLRARRAHLASVALRHGDRSIPHAALGLVAGALAQLPGAAGVSPASARALVALQPSLSSSFPVPPDDAKGPDALRRRTVALHELIAAISEEGPIALVIDDLHWMDESSARVLASVVQRLEKEPVLVVTTSRPRYSSLQAPDSGTISLASLTAPQVGALVASIGTLPDEVWAEDFAERLHAATGGVPLHVLEMLELLLDREALALRGTTWEAVDPGETRRVLGTGAASRDRLSALSDDDRATLLVVAIAGVPVDARTMSRALARDPGLVAESINRLEIRGLLVPANAGWQVVHDAIAELVLQDASPDERRRVHRGLGMAYAGDTRLGEDGLLRGARHLARAGETVEVENAFVRWLADLRRRGDARRTDELARDFLGDDLDGHSNIAKTAPLHLRVSRRLLMTVGVVTAALAIAIPAIAYWPATASPVPEATLLATVTDSGKTHDLFALDLQTSMLERTDVLEVRSGKPSKMHPPPDMMNSELSPDGTRWASQRTFGDSGGIDIVVSDARSGQETRITNSPSDDFHPSWSPDGTKLAFATGRFDPRSHSDIAIVDLKTRRVTQLTRGPETDGSASWNPNGTEIGFGRFYWDGRPGELCLIGVDGSHLRCSGIPNASSVSIYGWLDERRAVVVAERTDSTGVFMIGVLQTDTWEFRQLWTGRFDGVTVSPDGAWVACLCSKDLRWPTRWMIFPVARSDLARELVADRLGDEQVKVAWAGAKRSPRYVQRLAIDAPSSPLPLTAATQLRVTALDPKGRRVAVSNATWRSLTPAIARVDSETGMLMPLRSGTARLEISLGGWMVGQDSIVIAGTATRTLLTEDWSRGIDSAFVTYGTPRPDVGDTRFLKRALRVNGDGAFTSGVHTRNEFPGQQGLGMEVTASTPIDSMQWQALGIEITAEINADSLAAWDHETADPPRVTLTTRSGKCVAGLPGGEGIPAQQKMSAADGQGTHTPISGEVRSGKPYQLRVQLFPDGRCGIAINGTPILTLTGPPIRSPRYRMLIYGKSVGTEIAVGAVRIWAGVAPDIDWRRLDGLGPPL